MAVPHGVGSVWAQAAWEMYWALVNQYGFDANLYNAAGTAGNQRAMLYVNEGLQNTICSPAFTDVRDGIIQAAMDNHGGQDVCLLWNAFAGFGLGSNAVSGGPNSTTPTNGFGVPPACLPGGAPALSVNDVTVREGNPTATFTVTLSQAPSAPVTVNYATANNTAVSTTLDTTFTNSAVINLPDAVPASPYPATINIASVPGPITKVQARLNGFTHTFPSDLDILLQGPGGQTVVLMSDVGGGTDVSAINLTFSDTGAVPPSALVTGTYRPTDLGGADTYPAPAPAGPYGTALSVFNNVNPVGTWRLFVNDQFGLDTGSIGGGWSLILSTPNGDYTATSGTLTFNPGVAALTVPVQINEDALSEPNQSFFLNLSNPSNATIADAQGVGTIVDNDGGAPPPPPNSYADMAVDFGASYGLFLRYNQGGVGTWSSLHPLSPTAMASGHIDANNNADLVMTFPGFGVWMWMNNASWVQLHPLDATDIALGDLDNNGMDDIVLNFPGYGVWGWYNNASWTQLHVLNSSQIAVGNVDGDGGGRKDVVLTFPGHGVWTWANNTTWSQLHVLDASAIETGDLDGNGVAEIILTFPGYGVWARINNATWTQLHPLDSGAGITIANVDNDAAGKMDVVIDFPGFGVWVWYNNSTWIQLHPVNAGLLTTGDVDGNGQSDVIISFPGYGTWIWMNNGGWVQLHPLEPEGIVTGRVDNTFN
jgi:subtilisin-like proprotein convertase family protein